MKTTSNERNIFATEMLRSNVNMLWESPREGCLYFPNVFDQSSLFLEFLWTPKREALVSEKNENCEFIPFLIYLIFV